VARNLCNGEIRKYGAAVTSNLTDQSARARNCLLLLLYQFFHL